MYHSQILVISLLLISAWSSPIPGDQTPNNDSELSESLAQATNDESSNPELQLPPKNEYDLLIKPSLYEDKNDAPAPMNENEENLIETTSTAPKDLMGQETFYPVGGVWWGVRPWGGWGGWGGYRPWYGWHGWHNPHYGGHWGGHWGGGWGGGRWGGRR